MTGEEMSRHATEVNELRGTIYRLERELATWKRLALYWQNQFGSLRAKLRAWAVMAPGAGEPQFAPTLCPWDAYSHLGYETEVWFNPSTNKVMMMDRSDRYDREEEVFLGCAPSLFEVIERNGWAHHLRPYSPENA